MMSPSENLLGSNSSEQIKLSTRWTFLMSARRRNGNDASVKKLMVYENDAGKVVEWREPLMDPSEGIKRKCP